MRIDTKKLLKIAEEDYERAWLESAKLLKVKGKYFTLTNQRKSHPLFDLIIRFRNIFLDMGFTEVITPMIVEEKHVYSQYGPEAPVILDRVFYLAGLPRADIGIPRDKISETKKIVPHLEDTKQLQHIFRRYKKGKIESDNLVEVMVNELKIREDQATSILALFPEFRLLKPIPTNLTLRSHTTSAWFQILKEVQFQEPLPSQLFSIGPKFRREQKLDTKHLYESWTASMVIMAEEISLEDGQKIVEEAFNRLGLGEAKIRIKKATSKYYAPKMEFEVFIKHPKTNESIEIGDGGLYNPLSLAKYGIRHPVFNFGAGLERIAMITTGLEDIRKLVYPQLYVKRTSTFHVRAFTDEQLADMIKINRAPLTKDGRKLVNAIIQTAIKNADEPSPCQFLAYKGDFLGRNIEVCVYESDEGKKLIAPAALNTVYVYDGNVLGLPDKGLEKMELVRKAKEKGVSTGIRYLDAIAALAVATIEKEIKTIKTSEVNVRAKISKRPSDVNIKVEDVALRYIKSRKKRIIVKGPVFVGILARIAE